jgi:NAD+ synthetase
VHKNGFSGVVLGISGGIDSAVSAAVAVDALGAENVKGVLLPSPYTSEESIEDALYLAGLLCIQTMTVPITAGMDMCEGALNPLFKQDGWMENPLIGGNIQARLRGLMLMAISNRFGWMLLSTGNKSELSVGYSTLYGDSCGGYNVLKDLYKTQVYALANWRNKQGDTIPQRSIDKAPSAELAPGQKDEDQLPPYAILDEILFHHIELRESAEAIIARGFDAAVVNKVLRMVRMSEYKRRQSAPGVKLSSMLYGKDRRFPLTNKF